MVKAVDQPTVEFKSIAFPEDDLLSMTIRDIDNELLVTFNGVQRIYDHFCVENKSQHEPKFQLNPAIANVIVITVDNHGYPNGGSPASVKIAWVVGGQRYATEWSRPDNMRQGIVYQLILRIDPRK